MGSISEKRNDSSEDEAEGSQERLLKVGKVNVLEKYSSILFTLCKQKEQIVPLLTKHKNKNKIGKVAGSQERCIFIYFLVCLFLPNLSIYTPISNIGRVPVAPRSHHVLCCQYFSSVVFSHCHFDMHFSCTKVFFMYLLAKYIFVYCLFLFV